MVIRLKLGAKPSDHGPARQLLQAVERVSFRNPLNDRELVFDGVKVELWPASEQRLRVCSFDAMQPRVGNGTHALLRIAALADLYGAELELDAVPYGNRDEMSPKGLQAWYADRGGFVPEADTESAMLRLPQTVDHKGCFYGIAKPDGDALSDELLAALGLQIQRALDGSFAFRGDAPAVRELLQHAADLSLVDLAYRRDDAEPLPVPAMSFAQRMAELACVRWQLGKGEGDAPSLQQRLTELLQAPKASATAILRRARANAPDPGPTPD